MGKVIISMNNKMIKKSWYVLTFSLAISLSFLSCASVDDKNVNNAGELSKEIDELIDGSRYILALEKLQELKNKYPYAPESKDSQLRMADVYYLQENFPEAAATYEAFRDLHPKHPKVRYAMYRAGLSYYNDIPSLRGRDLTPAFKAQDSFKEFLSQFNEGEYFADVKVKLNETRNAIAEKELYIADFYFKNEDFEAAKNRYTKIVNFYTDTKVFTLAEEKLKKIDGKIK